MGLWHSTKKSPDYYVLPPCECVWGGGDNYFITFETPVEAAVCNPPTSSHGAKSNDRPVVIIYLCMSATRLLWLGRRAPRRRQFYGFRLGKLKFKSLSTQLMKGFPRLFLMRGSIDTGRRREGLFGSRLLEVM